MKKLTLTGVSVLAVGVLVGAAIPDADQRLPWLMHRSLLTHGLLLPLLLFIAVRQRFDTLPRLFLMGLSVAIAVHLCFDLFPRGLRGFALIWIPFYGRTSGAFSWWWMALSCVACLYLALLLVRHALEMLLSALSMVGAVALHGINETYAGFAVLTLLLTTTIAILLPSHAGVVWRSAARNAYRSGEQSAAPDFPPPPTNL